MAKYNITEKKEKKAAYRKLVSPQLMDEMYEKIINIIVVQKKYKDKEYSAKRLAEDLGTNTRYVSAVVNAKFHMNYTTLVNKYRVEEAMNILADKRYRDLTIQEVGDMAGFSNRQSFYGSFFRFNNITPREYRMTHLDPLPKKKPVKKKKVVKPKKKVVKKKVVRKKKVVKPKKKVVRKKKVVKPKKKVARKPKAKKTTRKPRTTKAKTTTGAKKVARKPRAPRATKAKTTEE